MYATPYLHNGHVVAGSPLLEEIVYFDFFSREKLRSALSSISQYAMSQIPAQYGEWTVLTLSSLCLPYCVKTLFKNQKIS